MAKECRGVIYLMTTVELFQLPIETLVVIITTLIKIIVPILLRQIKLVSNNVVQVGWRYVVR